MRKRYYLTLTKENVEELQELARAMKLSQGFVSEVCDEAIEKTIPLLRKIHSKGTLSVTDLFTMIGEQIEDAANREKENAPERKTKKTERSGD